MTAKLMKVRTIHTSMCCYDVDLPESEWRAVDVNGKPARHLMPAIEITLNTDDPEILAECKARIADPSWWGELMKAVGY